MSSVRKLYGAFERSDGRIKLMTLLGVSGLVIALGVLLMSPALAGSGAPSQSGVQPSEVEYGGGSGACAVYSNAQYELHINNPIDGIFTGPDGTSVSIDVSPNATTSGDSGMYFDFEFLNNPTMYAFDIVVNGGAKNTHYDYNKNGNSGAVRADQKLHAPTKGGSSNLYNLSHINLCYGELPFADLMVTKVAKSSAADVGDVVEFEITVRNNGPATATNVVVTDLINETDDDPAVPLMSLAEVAGNDDWDLNGEGQPTQTIASIAPGAANEVTLSIFLEIEAVAAGRDDVANGVSVSADQEDPDGSDNSDQSLPVIEVGADVSGVKYHDRDVDGEQDATREEGMNGWTIAAFDSNGQFVASADTDTVDSVDGVYTIAGLPPGDYTICEVKTSLGLPISEDDPSDGSGYEWAWTQSEPSGEPNCVDGEGQPLIADGVEVLPLGYVVTVDGPKTGLDFGNHIQVGIRCDEDVTINLDGADDDPAAEIRIPAGTPSCSGEELWETTFDLGRSVSDGDDWNQFVVFGGLETADPRVMEMDIHWAPEDAVYVDGSLVVPTTEISLVLPALTLDNIELCANLGGDPTPADPVCLDSRVIDEGGDLFYEVAGEIVGQIQVTDYIKFLGDPGYFR